MRQWWTDWKFWLGMACSVLFLILALQQVDWGSTLTTIQEADVLLLCLGGGALVMTFVLFSCRWRVLLSGIACLSVRDAFSYIMIGYLGNTVFPLRMGEVARAALLGRRHGISTSLVLGSVVLERTFDVLSMLVFALGVSVLMDIPPVVRTGLVTFAGGGLATLIGLIVLVHTGDRVPGWVARLPGLNSSIPVKRLVGLVVRFTAGLDTLRNTRQLGLVLGLSALASTMAGVATTAFIAAFHLSTPWYAGFFVLAVVNLGAAIPSSPGSIGVYHYCAILALSVWGTDKSTALGYAIGTHGINILIIILIGCGCLVREGIALRSLGVARQGTSLPVLPLKQHG